MDRYREGNVKKLSLLFSIISILCFNFSSWASDFHSARTLGLGGAGHANPLLSDAIYLNPSYTSFIQTHSLSGNFQKFKTTESNPNREGRIYNISVLDGAQDSLFQAGLGFTQREDGALIHLATSKNITDHFGLGIGTKVALPNSNPNQRFTDTSFSITAILSESFQVAFIADNLLENGKALNLYREFTLGTKINIKSILLIYIDPHWIPNHPANEEAIGYEVGIEIPFLSDFFLRAGRFKNSLVPFQNKRTAGFGLGAGWLGPKLSLDYGFSRVTENIQASSHEAGITIYF
jgi:hypothetical protein